MENKRLNYLDNIKWMTAVIVILYHIIYIFNNSGVVTNLDIKGIPILDTFLIFVYPWFMCLLFIVSGISCKYSLEKRSNKEFLKERAKRILIPSTLGMFVYCWIIGVITNHYADMFQGAYVPGAVKYLIYCLVGSGPLWFCHVLFLGCVLIVLLRKIDKKDRITKLCSKINIPVLMALVILVWGSSFVLNMPVITVYRFGIYLLMMLFGYYIFSNKELIKKLENISIPLAIISVISGILYTIYYYGQNFTESYVLTHIFTNAYLWIAILAIFGIGSKYLNFKNKFTEYMTKNNFYFYILHYVLVLTFGFLVTAYLHLPFILNYVLILIGTAISMPILIAIISKIPVLRFLVLGISKKKEMK